MDLPGPHISVGGNVGGHIVVGDQNTVTGAGDVGAGSAGRASPEKAGATGPGSVHRAIVCVDIEHFGDQDRTDRHRAVARKGLYDGLKTAFESAGIPLEDCHVEDRGDGALILVGPGVSKDLLVTRVPRELAIALAGHNALYAKAAQIRVRVSVHAGEVSFDERGVVGNAVNLAFRILDAAEAKQALRDTSGEVALIASAWLFDEVIRHSPAAMPGSYRAIGVSVKETQTTAWVRAFGEER
jgi:class 3 adenylate cyclase